MKKSFYNFFYEHEKTGEIIAYNSRFNSLALISSENYELFKTDRLDLATDQLLIDLKKGGFIIEDSIDELDMLSYQMLNNRFNSKSLALTIAPTLDCNFACLYCYEKGSSCGMEMNEEVKKAIIEMVKNNIDSYNSVSITWYGGEPLLALDCVTSMTDEIRNICSEKKKYFSAGIITNGYLMTKDVISKLKELELSYIQVTLDGTKDTHDLRRPLISGGGSYDQIINNLFNTVDELSNISLRVNLDKNNQNEIYDVLELLKNSKLNGKIHIYPGYVEPTNNCYSNDTCLQYSIFTDIEYKFTEESVKSGSSNSFIHKYPKLKTNICGADNLNSVVISPNGDLYKCWSDIGRSDYKIGNVLTKESTNHNILFGYMLYDPKYDKECSECKFLPICMGGCPRRRIDKMENRCTEQKFQIENYLKSIVNDIVEKRNNLE